MYDSVQCTTAHTIYNKEKHGNDEKVDSDQYYPET